MKMKKNPLMKGLLASGLILAFTAVTACSSDGSKHQSSHSEKEHAMESAAGPEFSDAKVKAVYTHYVHVKNALISADAKEAATGGAALKTALLNIGNTKAADLAGKIAGAKTITEQREKFDALTAEVEKVVKSAKITGGKIYKQHCPMANGGKGGYWLANESSVRNPYYGDDMLSCGTVEEEIK
ncbi:DUF3347 domain-containing protein [Arcticibacter tournemirensis]|uniref:DUF3347 domain-containing protein n=2 Tax=Arcticibacter tournemirensis TaxID=699437 RepID=A0A4Q0M4C5_9SPHI|nr:DUF3347 domain-containing protein [Arcticibacter tournemirensis]